MELPVHILFAVASIVASTTSAFFPSVRILQVSGFVTGVTLISGVAVGIERGTSLTYLCTLGLLYVAYIATAIGMSIRKLSFRSKDNHRGI